MQLRKAAPTTKKSEQRWSDTMGLIADLKNKSQDIPLPGLLKEPLIFLRRNKTDLEREREELLTKIEILTARNRALAKIAEIDPDQQDDQLSEPELAILRFVAKQVEASAAEVSDALGCNPARAEYLLSRLLENDYLVDSQLLGRHSYLVDRRGRDYLDNTTEADN